MKKLIAISVMCALVTWAAFADTTFGGQIFVKGELFNGTNETDSLPGTGAIGLDNYNTLVKMTFGDNTAGGWLGIHNNNGNYYHGFAWWRPIPQLKLQIGRNQDGDFGVAQISGWGFTSEAKNLVAMGEYSGDIFGLAHARTTGWYGGISGWAIEASIFAVEGLSINLAIPFGNSQAAGLTFSKFEANIVYRIVDVGNVTVSFQSNTGYVAPDPVKDGPRVKDADYADDQKTSWAGGAEQTGTPKVFASFFLTAIENMAVDLGVAYQFPLDYSYDVAATQYVPQYTYNYKQDYPVEIGLGFRYTAGDFGFKLRSGVSLGGSIEATNRKTLEDVLDKEQIKISINILPTYKIKTVTAYLYAGVGMQIVEDYETTERTPDMSFGGYTNKVGGGFRAVGENMALSWFVNPYVLIPVGSMRFLAGFQIYSDGIKYPNGDNPLIKWAVPFGFYTYF